MHCSARWMCWLACNFAALVSSHANERLKRKPCDDSYLHGRARPGRVGEHCKWKDSSLERTCMHALAFIFPATLTSTSLQLKPKSHNDVSNQRAWWQKSARYLKKFRSHLQRPESILPKLCAFQHQIFEEDNPFRNLERADKSWLSCQRHHTLRASILTNELKSFEQTLNE